MKKWLSKYKKLIKLCILGLIIGIAISIVYDYVTSVKMSDMKEVTYEEFIKMAKEGKIDTVYYSTSKEVMKFTLLNDDTKSMTRKERDKYKYKAKDYRKTLYPAYPEFRKDMLNYGVNLKINGESLLVTILANSGSIIFLILMIYIIKSMMGDKSLRKEDILQESNIRFSDVIGQDEIIDDIKFIVKLIKEPKLGNKIGAKTPKGILLTGEPGTGKTLIAKAIAGEAQVPFISMGGSDFKELFVGLGAKRVRELFKIARENSPCIIFIDEIDSIGVKRGKSGSNSEDDSTINALLKEMDGFSSRDGIFVIAATNRPEELDDALKRAGRFDRQIAVNPPRDWTVRKELLDHYLDRFKVSEDVNTESISKQIIGFTGADIAMICNESSIVALMKEKSCIDTECIEEAIDKKIFNGNRSKKEKYIDDKKIVAYHESGHAVVTYLMKQPISRASIISTTSGVGGFVMQSESDSLFTTDEEFRKQVMIAFGGRASEQIKFGKVTTGASNDITQATNIMYNYIQRYGFDKDFGLLDVSVLESKQLVDAKDTVTRLSSMSKEMYDRTYQCLAENYKLVEILANKLLECETLSGNEIEKLLKDAQNEA